MNSNNMILPFKDFLSQVNSKNLKGDISLTETYVLKSKFKTWKAYLKNRYDLYSTMADFDAIANEIGSVNNGLTTFSGDIELIINKHLKLDLFNPEESWFRKLKPTKLQSAKIVDFEVRLLQLFFRLQINHIKDIPGMTNTLSSMSKDFEIQQAKNKPEFLDSSSYVDSVSMPNMNRMIENLARQNEPPKNFYFADKSAYLKTIHEALVSC